MNKIFVSYMLKIYILLILITVVNIKAQNVQYTNGNSNGEVGLSSRVDPSSLGLNLTIQLADYPGRKSGLPIIFRYNSKVWDIRFNGSEYDVANSRTLTYTEPVYSQYSLAGWSSSLAAPSINFEDTLRRYDEYGSAVDLDNPREWEYFDPYWVVPRLKIRMPDGSVKEFRRGDWIAEFHYGISNTNIWVGDFYSVDGSKMRYNTYDRTLYLPDGSRYVHEPNSYSFSKYIDVNGNVVNYTSSYISDTMGRQIPYLPFPQGVQNLNYVVLGLNGVPLNYLFKWQALENSLTENQPLRYLGNCGQLSQPLSPSLFQGDDGVSGAICDSGREIFNPVVLSEIVLPNGTSYKFTYNVWGEIDKIVYPTGAYERFEYAQIWGTSFVGEPYYLANRGIVKKWLSKDGNSSNEILWQYENPGHGIFRTIYPDNTKSERIYSTPSNITRFGFEDARSGKFLQEKFYNSSGVLVKRVINEYQNSGVVGTPPSLPNSTFAINYSGANREFRLTKTINIIIEPGSNQALATMSQTVYDSNSNYYQYAHLNPKQIKSYGYVAMDLANAQTANIQSLTNYFTNKTPISIREADYQYTSYYLSRNLIGLATETRMLNPLNPSEVLSRSQNVYDEQNLYYSLLDYGSTTGYEAPTGNYSYLRGNVTTKRTWLKDTNTWLESHTQFDNFGNVRKVWEANGSPSRYHETEYDPVYKYAYATKIKVPAPDTTGIHGMAEGSETTRTFDSMTGLMLSFTDANGQTTTTEYDSALRPKRVIPPAGSSVAETIYNDDVNDIWIKVRQQIDDNNWAEQTRFFDKLGRLYKTKTKDRQGDIFTEIKYDSLGRVEKRSSPYRQGEQILWAKPRYDDLNRVVEAYAPAPEGLTGNSLWKVELGISTIQDFVGPYVISKDASGRQFRTISGDYGILRVDEATATTGNVVTDLGTLENPNQSSFYSYNINGELIKITQGNPEQAGQPYQKRYFMYDSLGRIIRVRQPEQIPNPNLQTSGNPENNQWTAAYTYDILGNVIRMTDAKGVNIINEYDNVGRLVNRCYTKSQIQTTAIQCSGLSSSELSLDTPSVNYYYDGKGLSQVPQFSRGALTKVTNSISENRYVSFDNNGRLLTSQQITDGQTYNFSYKYNLAGGLIEETYPSGRVIKNFADSDGGLATVSSKTSNGQFKTYATNFDYSSNGAVKAMMFGNGRWETTQFNELNQLIQIGLGNSATDKSLWKVDYEYGELNGDESNPSVNILKNNGSVARQTITLPTTSFVQTYKYDALNRLSEARETAANGSQNWKQTFSYDRFGNRTGFYQKVGDDVLIINNQTLPQIDPYTNQFTTGQGYVYDYNGNLIQDSQNRSFSFNGDDKQTEVRDLTIPTSTNNPDANIIGRYYYDGRGARVKKVTNTESTVFVYNGSGTLVAEYSTQQNPEPQTSYLTIDRLGSPRVITDKNGNVISRRDFMPYGEELYAGVGARTATLKYSTTGIDNIRKRFTGYEKDEETNLDYANARMYQNKHGRFTTVDPLMASADAFNPQTFNRYTYTGNDPINRTDPNGLRWVKDANNEIYWIPDDEDLKGRTDVTGQTITLNGGCDAVAGCVTPGTTVTFNKDRSITIESVGNEPVVQEQVDVVNDVIETISTVASEVATTIQSEFASTPTTTAPTIDLPTSPGPGPLEPIDPGGSPTGGSDTGGGEVDAGGAEPGTDVDTSGDWKVTAAKIIWFAANACYQTNCLSSDEEDDEDLVYHGTTEGSADDIVQNGLDEDKWRNSDPTGIDEEGFFVTTDPEKAWGYAEGRALLRGGTPAVIAAKRSDLESVLNKPRTGMESHELYIKPKDFPKVPGGVFWREF